MGEHCKFIEAVSLPAAQTKGDGTLYGWWGTGEKWYGDQDIITPTRLKPNFFFGMQSDLQQPFGEDPSVPPGHATRYNTSVRSLVPFADRWGIYRYRDVTVSNFTELLSSDQSAQGAAGQVVFLCRKLIFKGQGRLFAYDVGGRAERRLYDDIAFGGRAFGTFGAPRRPADVTEAQVVNLIGSIVKRNEHLVTVAEAPRGIVHGGTVVVVIAEEIEVRNDNNELVTEDNAEEIMDRRDNRTFTEYNMPRILADGIRGFFDVPFDRDDRRVHGSGGGTAIVAAKSWTGGQPWHVTAEGGAAGHYSNGTSGVEGSPGIVHTFRGAARMQTLGIDAAFLT